MRFPFALLYLHEVGCKRICLTACISGLWPPKKKIGLIFCMIAILQKCFPLLMVVLLTHTSTYTGCMFWSHIRLCIQDACCIFDKGVGYCTHTFTWRTVYSGCQKLQDRSPRKICISLENCRLQDLIVFIV